jgi:hypothetical protein
MTLLNKQSQSKLNNVMIDIETMGTDPYSGIISIGAVFFDPYTGTLGKDFYAKVSLDSCQKYGLTLDASTVQWWIKQNEEAQKVFHGYKDSLPIALDKFNRFLTEDGITRKTLMPWGNGASFDITLMECAYKACSVKTPWDYWNVRDVRTIVELTDDLCDFHKTGRSGVHHNAKDDAIFQAQYVAKKIALLRPDLSTQVSTQKLKEVI